MEYKWIAQDKDGAICLFVDKPVDIDEVFWLRQGGYILKQQDLGRGHFLTNWRDSLINLETHDYKIEDGILMKVEKEQIFKGSELQYRDNDGEWKNCYPDLQYRLKPKVIRFRNYICSENVVRVFREGYDLVNFKEWIGDWQEVTINE